MAIGILVRLSVYALPLPYHHFLREVGILACRRISYYHCKIFVLGHFNND